MNNYSTNINATNIDVIRKNDNETKKPCQYIKAKFSQNTNTSPENESTWLTLSIRMILGTFVCVCVCVESEREGTE